MKNFSIYTIYLLLALFIFACTNNSQNRSENLDGKFKKIGDSYFFQSNQGHFSFEFDKNNNLISIRDRIKSNIYAITNNDQIRKILHLKKDGIIEVSVYNEKGESTLISISGKSDYFSIHKISNLEKVKFFKFIHDPTNSWHETECYTLDVEKKDTSKYFMISYNDGNYKILTDLNNFRIGKGSCDSSLLIFAKTKYHPKFSSPEEGVFIPNFEGFNEDVIYNNTSMMIQRSKKEVIFGGYYGFSTKKKQLDISYQHIIIDDNNPHLLFAKLRNKNKEIIDKEIRTLYDLGLTKELVNTGVLSLKVNKLVVSSDFIYFLNKFKAVVK